MNTCPNCHFPDLNSLGVDDEDCARYRCPQCGKEFADCYEVEAPEHDNGVQNLTASVEVYEVEALSPFTIDIATYIEDDAFDKAAIEEMALMPEVKELLEYIDIGDRVRIDPMYGIGEFEAFVEEVYEELGCVKVYHAKGGYPCGTWAIEDVRLVTKRAALTTAEAEISA